MLSASSSRHVKSVRTAFGLVGILQERDGATVAELVDELDLARSTVQNYLSTLESMGYVVEHDGTYELGLRFLTHGIAAQNRLPIRRSIRRVLADVAEETSLSAWWVCEELGRGIFVDGVTPEGGSEIYGRVGKRSYLHTHAPGKAILASLSPETVEAILDHHGLPVYTKHTVTDEDELFEQLDRIRSQGYAFTEGEVALGVQSVGVSLNGPGDRTHAIGLFGYSHDLGGDCLDEEIPRVLKRAAAEITEDVEGTRIR